MALAKRKKGPDLLLLGTMEKQNNKNSYTVSSFNVSSIVQNASPGLFLILTATLGGEHN